MASTNKTQNLELSQFLGTDKPAWLADYNSDMEKIDNAFGNLSTEVSNIPLIKEELEEQDESLSARIDSVNTKILEMEEVNEQEAQELITLKNNYETMHHEMVLTNEKVQENSADIETLMNTVSGVYSTVEREVGTWIDGKKIYEKTVVVNASNLTKGNGATGSQYTGTVISGVGNIININGYYYCYDAVTQTDIKATFGTCIVSPETGLPVYAGNLRQRFNAVDISIFLHNSSNLELRSLAVTCWYTKA